MYNIEDFDIIQDNLRNIKEKADKKSKKILEPTRAEVIHVSKIILDFIIKKKRILYGGMAQNFILKYNNLQDVFYSEIDGAYFSNNEIADIEFYSYNPISDTIHLTELLHNNNFKYIDAKEALHANTYKIFVNFTPYCDISLIPKDIYSKIPIIKINNVLCASPYFMVMDAFRVLTDPLTSYWRLDKVLDRFQKILCYYPLDINFEDNNISKLINRANCCIPSFIGKFIFNKIIKNNKFILVGLNAYKYYIKFINNDKIIKSIKNTDKDVLLSNNSSVPCSVYYEIISINYDYDVKYIYKLLKYKYKNITTKEFYPFIELMDKRTEFYYNNILILVIYNNNNRCIVYKYSKKYSMYIGTFNLVIMYLLFNSQYYYTLNNNNMKKLFLSCVSRLWLGRKYYFMYNKINILSKSKFQDFSLKCIGYTIQPLRLSLIENIKKKKFRYNPNGKIPIKIPITDYPNISGKQILNKKYLKIKN